MQHSVNFTFEFVNEEVENDQGESQVTKYSLVALFDSAISLADIDEKIGEFASISEEMFGAVHDFSAGDNVQVGYTSYEVEPKDYNIVFHGFVCWFYGYGAKEIQITKHDPEF